MDTLPYVDQHSVVAEAPAEAVWDAALRLLNAPLTGVAGRYARAVGVRSDRLFDVETSERPVLLGLAGQHHFSRYRLTFTLRVLGPGRTELTATTNAAFPGPAGKAYRTAVIGSRAHVLMTRRILRRIAREAALRDGR